MLYQEHVYKIDFIFIRKEHSAEGDNVMTRCVFVALLIIIVRECSEEGDEGTSSHNIIALR